VSVSRRHLNPNPSDVHQDTADRDRQRSRSRERPNAPDTSDCQHTGEPRHLSSNLPCLPTRTDRSNDEETRRTFAAPSHLKQRRQ